jgi:hypothetical protein
VIGHLDVLISLGESEGKGWSSTCHLSNCNMNSTGECEKDCRIEEEECKRADDPAESGQCSSGSTYLLDIDKKLLIDPKQLFIGSKIGEGAHGKVYEGK